MCGGGQATSQLSSEFLGVHSEVRKRRCVLHRGFRAETIELALGWSFLDRFVLEEANLSDFGGAMSCLKIVVIGLHIT